MSEALGTRGSDLLRRAARRLGGELEVYEKRGRSRTYLRDPEGESVVQSVEAGWALRGGDARRSWFLAGSGDLPSEPRPSEATAHPLRLPPSLEVPTSSAPRGLDAPLASEAEGMALLSGIARELARELPDAELISLRLDEGASESMLGSTRGVSARVRARSAVLRAEAIRGGARVEAQFLAHAASELKPLALARRLADRLTALGGKEEPPGGATLLLAPPLAARLLEALAPWLVGTGARRRLADRLDDEGGLAGDAVSIVDDGSHAEGVLAAPFDGEGVPCRERTLVAAGRFERALEAWWELEDPAVASGCSLRPGWRDLPRRGPTQIFFAPAPRITVGELVEQGDAVAYLLAAEGGVRLAADRDRFTVPVSALALTSGRASGGLGRCRLRGSLFEWLRGILALGRDLAFVPGVGLYGSPSLLVRGLELVAEESSPAKPG